MIKLFDFLFAIPRWAGFTGAILFAILYHAGSLYFGFSIAVIWLFIFLIIGGMVSGMRLSLALAILICAYTVFALPGEPGRVIQGAIASILTAVLVGGYSHYSRHLLEQARLSWIEAELQRDIVRGIEEAAQLLEDANGNIAKVKKIRIDVQAVLYNFSFPDKVLTY